MRASTLALCAVLFAACSTNQPERLDAARPDVSIATDGSVDVTNPDVNDTVADAADGSLAPDVASTSDASDAADVASDVFVDGGCFVGTPHTRGEFLNRCTDAETTDKLVTLPLARPDGTLPPLP